MNFFVPDWFVWLFGSISTLVTVGALLLAAFGNKEDEEIARRILGGYWGTVVFLAITAVVMTFAVKPVLNAIWEFIF